MLSSCLSFAVTSKARKALARLGVEIEAGAEASAKGVAMDAKHSTAAELNATAAFNAQHIKTKVYSRGATIPRENPDDWFGQVIDAPTPLQFNLLRLDSLNLPISPSKKDHLSKALNGYCTMLKDDPKSVVGSCEQPSDRQLPLPSEDMSRCDSDSVCRSDKHSRATGLRSPSACREFCSTTSRWEPTHVSFDKERNVCKCFANCSTARRSPGDELYALGDEKCPGKPAF